MSLEENIKCGNSLIDDEEVAGELAFKWEQEFPDVFEKGGFDIVIGNPPYVSTKKIDVKHRDFYWEKFSKILFSEMDLYQIFIYSSIDKLLNSKGYLGVITPNSYFTNMSFNFLRKFILDENKLLEIIDFPYRFFPFEEVNTETAILLVKKVIDIDYDVKFKVANKNIKSLDSLKDFKNKVKIKKQNIKTLYESKFILNINTILEKLLKFDNCFGNYLELHKGWMSIPNEIEINYKILNKGILSKDEVLKYGISNLCSKYLEGRDIHRYYFDNVEKYVYTSKMDKRTQNWHNNPKIILQRIVGQNKNKIFATVDFENYIIFPNANLVNLKNENENILFYLGILNSKLISYFYNLYYGETNTNLTKNAFESIPIPNLTNVNFEKKVFIEKTEEMLKLNKLFQNENTKFINNLKREFSLEKISKKVENWYELEYFEFLKEIEKQKIKLKFSKKEELEEYFETKKSKILEIKNKIDETDSQIDKMVYKLYDLTDDEIKIIEGE